MMIADFGATEKHLIDVIDSKFYLDDDRIN